MGEGLGDGPRRGIAGAEGDPGAAVGDLPRPHRLVRTQEPATSPAAGLTQASGMRQAIM